jgi:hypothetical protein
VGSIRPASLNGGRALVCVGRVRGKLVRHDSDYSVFLSPGRGEGRERAMSLRGAEQ